jgi:hypothetical protein
VLFGERPYEWTSADGLAWELHLIEAWAGFRADRVIWWHDRFVAAGAEGDGTDVRVPFWTSGDGVDWRRVEDRPLFAMYQGSAIKDYVGDFELAGGYVIDLYVQNDKLVAEGRGIDLL